MSATTPPMLPKSQNLRRSTFPSPWQQVFFKASRCWPQEALEDVETTQGQAPFFGKGGGGLGSRGRAQGQFGTETRNLQQLSPAEKLFVFFFQASCQKCQAKSM